METTHIAKRPAAFPAARLPATEYAADAPVLYVLHSGGLFGTERMAIATLRELGAGSTGLLLAPPGGAVGHAREQGLTAETFSGTGQLLRRMMGFFRQHRQVALVATGVSHSIAGILLAALMGVRLRHVHIVHGGTDERLSYGRKKWLRWFAVDYVAVSGFVRQRLLAHGVPAARIRVVENFLTCTHNPSRAAFSAPIVRAVMVSRLDPIKRVGLLLDALQSAAMSWLEVDVYGKGWEEAALRERAAAAHLKVNIAGYAPNVPELLARADLLIHTCPEEPFGLAILEAMAAGVPVLVPDSGGPATFVRDGENGFVYRANDSAHLAERLLELRQTAPQDLNRIVAAARATLRERFSPACRVEDYRNLLRVRPV